TTTHIYLTVFQTSLPLTHHHPVSLVFFLLRRHPLRSTLFPYTTLFRSLWYRSMRHCFQAGGRCRPPCKNRPYAAVTSPPARTDRSEEHTSELQSLRHLVCRLLLEKKKKKKTTYDI